MKFLPLLAVLYMVLMTCGVALLQSIKDKEPEHPFGRYVWGQSQIVINKYKPLAEASLQQIYLQGAKHGWSAGYFEVGLEKEDLFGDEFEIAGYELTRLLRGRNGDYFWYRYRSDSPPVFKPMDDADAKILLEEKYLPRNEAHHGASHDFY